MTYNSIKMKSNSILNETQLDIDNFEGAIAVGIKPAALLVMFNATGKEMDEWCVENYGRNFATTFEMVKQCAYKEFLTTVKTLGYRGNPSALNIINQAINDNAASNVVKIVFDNNVSIEGEDDKEDKEDE